MLDAAAKLGKIIVGMNKVLGDIPVTVKLRTGVKDGRNTAHKLMPRLGAEFGAGCLTVRPFTFHPKFPRNGDTMTLAPWAHSPTTLHQTG